MTLVNKMRNCNEFLICVYGDVSGQRQRTFVKKSSSVRCGGGEATLSRSVSIPNNLFCVVGCND